MPAVRRPKPIPKPSISISTEAAGLAKAWQDVAAETIKPGDLVIGMGLVIETGSFSTAIKIYFKSGKTNLYEEGEIVRIFSEKRG